MKNINLVIVFTDSTTTTFFNGGFLGEPGLAISLLSFLLPPVLEENLWQQVAD